MVRFDDRDLCVNEEAQDELQDRLEVEHLPEIPQVFLNGEHIGVRTKFLLRFTISTISDIFIFCYCIQPFYCSLK